MHRAILCLLAATWLGCGSTDPDLPKLHPVSGVVTLDNQPLARATVNFVPQGMTVGVGSTGITDATGKYTLSTIHQGNGAPAGEYMVIINKMVRPDGSEFPPDFVGDPMSTAQKELLPKQYSDPQQGQPATIPEGGGMIDFALKSKP